MLPRILPGLGRLALALTITAVLVWPPPGPAAANPLMEMAAATAGGDHTCALTTEGGVRCWGENGKGQLGDGTTTQRATAADVVGLGSGIAAVAAGGVHTCALTTAGGVDCWGWNRYGQLGNGTTSGLAPNPAPVGVVGLGSGVAALAAGGVHTCALTTAGGVKCWGWNHFGQLGDGQACGNVCPAPVDVMGLSSDVAAVAAGDNHTCAVTTAGGVKCWGRNLFSQLGAETTESCDPLGGSDPCSTTAVEVVELSGGVAAVAAGGRHTCALTTAGGARCWGDNGRGQLGDGTRTQRTTPVDVVGLSSGVASVGAGGGHTCALTTATGLKCWGENAAGELGDGQACGTVCPSPVAVARLGSDAAAVAVGGSHACALTTEGGLQCWGDNVQGQLGDGTRTQRATPVDVVALNSTPGDANCSGAVNSIDATLVAQFDAGLIDALPCLEDADVNEDGSVNTIDAALILQFDAGLVPRLPP